MAVPGKIAFDTWTNGSEEYVELVCEPCYYDHNKNLCAVGYCENCQEFLCEKCFAIHCQPRPMRNHVLRDANSMPKTLVKTRTICIDPCPVHPGKVIEFFCKDHDKMLCMICINVNHRACTEVKFIPEIVADLESSTDMSKFNQSLETVSENLEIQKYKIKVCKHAIDVFKDTAKSRIAELRHQMNDMFDQLEKDVEKETKDLQETDIMNLNKLSNMCDTISCNLQNVKDMKNKRLKDRQMCQLFVAMKKTQATVNTLSEQLNEVREKTQIHHYILQADQLLLGLTSPPKTLGKLVVTSEKRAVFVYDINVTAREDRGKCCISGLEFLSSHRLIATDYNNKSVKLIDVKDKALISNLVLESSPSDVTMMSSRQVAVTLPLIGKILLIDVSMSGCLSVESEINACGKCYGIVRLDPLGNRCIISFSDTNNVSIVEIVHFSHGSETIQAKLTNDLKSFNPQYVTLSPDGMTIYVTTINNKVISLDFQGKIKAHRESINELKGLAVDGDGAIYVCSGEAIMRMTSDLQKFDVAVDNLKGASMPRSVIYCNKFQQLYIGMERESIIKVYNFV